METTFFFRHAGRPKFDFHTGRSVIIRPRRGDPARRPTVHGLVNLLQGDGDVGARLTGHPIAVDMVGFTGSYGDGPSILNTASKT